MDILHYTVTGRSVTLEDDNAVSIEGYGEDKSGDETPQASNSTSAPRSTATIDKIRYQELAKARKYARGEKHLKQALVKHAKEWKFYACKCYQQGCPKD